MNISKYTSYFHDGYVFSLDHASPHLIISMESAELSNLEEHNHVPQLKLSQHFTIKGKLHLENLKSITINNTPFYDTLIMPADDGNIFSLYIDNHKVTLEIFWMTTDKEPPFHKIELTAAHIWWENLPNLINPNWE